MPKTDPALDHTPKPIGALVDGEVVVYPEPVDLNNIEADAGDYAIAATKNAAAGLGKWGTGIASEAGRFVQAPVDTLRSYGPGIVAGFDSLLARMASGTSQFTPEELETPEIQAIAQRAAERAARTREGNLAAPGNTGAFARLGHKIENAGSAGTAQLTEIQRDDLVIRRQQQAVDDAEGFWGNAGAVVTNPVAATGIVAEFVPDMFVGLGAGAMAAKIARAAKTEQGMRRLRAAGITQQQIEQARTIADTIAMPGAARAARSQAFNEAAHAANTSAYRAATVTGVGAEALSSTMHAGANAREQVMQMSPDRLERDSVRYRKILAQTNGDAQMARKLLAEEVGLIAGGASGAGTAVGYAGARTASSAIARLIGARTGDITAQMVARSRRVSGREALGNVGRESLEEMAQNPMEELGANTGLRKADPNADFDALGAAGQGAAFGALMGAPGSAAGYLAQGRARQTNGPQAPAPSAGNPATQPQPQQSVDDIDDAILATESQQTQSAQGARANKQPTRARQYLTDLEARYNLPKGLLDAVWAQESGRGASMRSPAGAMGHFQFMPDTARQYGLANPDDFYQSANAAARMFGDLLGQTGGDLRSALAGYNWGIGHVRRDGLAKMPSETRNYIANVTARMAGADRAATALPAEVLAEEEENGEELAAPVAGESDEQAGEKDGRTGTGAQAAEAFAAKKERTKRQSQASVENSLAISPEMARLAGLTMDESPGGYLVVSGDRVADVIRAALPDIPSYSMAGNSSRVKIGKKSGVRVRTAIEAARAEAQRLSKLTENANAITGAVHPAGRAGNIGRTGGRGTAAAPAAVAAARNAPAARSSKNGGAHRQGRKASPSANVAAASPRQVQPQQAQQARQEMGGPQDRQASSPETATSVSSPAPATGEPAPVSAAPKSRRRSVSSDEGTTWAAGDPFRQIVLHESGGNLAKAASLPKGWENSSSAAQFFDKDQVRAAHREALEYLASRKPQGAKKTKPVREKTGEPDVRPDAKTESGAAVPTKSSLGPAKAGGQVQASEILTFDQYAARNGLRDYGEAGTHNPLGHLSSAQKRRIEQETSKRLAEHKVLQDELRQRYQNDVAAGSVRPPGRIEKLIAQAKGHTDNKSVQAARRLLEKQGYNETIWGDSAMPAPDRGGGLKDAKFSRARTPDRTPVEQWRDDFRNLIRTRGANGRATMATPSVLRAMGEGAELGMSFRHAWGIREKHRDVPESVFSRLPGLLNDPVFVIPHEQGGVSVVIDAISDNGSPLIVGVRDGEIRTITPSDDTSTMSGQERIYAKVAKAAATRGAKVYARNRKAIDDAMAFGLRQHLRGANAPARNARTNILTRDQIVNPSRQSRKPVVENPSTVAQLRADAVKALGERVVKRLEDSGALRIHDTAETLPEALRSQAGGNVAGVFDGSTIHLVGSGIEHGNGGAVLRHEAWHMLLAARRLQDSRGYKTLMRQLDAVERMAATSKGGAGAWFDAAMARIPVIDKTQGRERVLEELGAYAIEEYSRAPQSVPATVGKWVRDFIVRVKEWLALNIGLPVKNLTAADLSRMAERFLRGLGEDVQTIRRDGTVTAALSRTQGGSAQTPVGRTINASTDENLIFTALAQFDEAFQQPTPKGKTVADIAAEIDPAYRVAEMPQAEAQGHAAAQGWVITGPSGRQAFVFEGKRRMNENTRTQTPVVWIDVSRFEPGVDAGNKVYGIVAGYARNTGRVFIGDPMGLTQTGMYRRLENMISTALRYGTTDHIHPHPNQLDPARFYGDNNLRGMSLDWKPGEFAHNLTEMLQASYNAATQNVPEIAHHVYDFDRQEFVDTRTGRGRDRRGLTRLPGAGRSGTDSSYHSGSATLARAAIFNTVVRGKSEKVRANGLAIVGSLISRPGLEKNLRDVFYSIAKPAAPDNAPQPVRWGVEIPDARVARAFDAVTYQLQDKYVDLKRTVRAIREAGHEIADALDPHAAENLMHGRVMDKTKRFMEEELRPILDNLRLAQIDLPEFERFLHARHAPERNAAMARRNPSVSEVENLREAARSALEASRRAGQQDVSGLEDDLRRAEAIEPWQGTEKDRLALSGMSDGEAAQVLEQWRGKGARGRLMEDLAKRVDAVVRGTRTALLRYGLETPETVTALEEAYEHYVPLQRDMEESDLFSPSGDGSGSGVGNVRGSRVRRATGSTREVEHIFANLAAAREAAIVRGEKNLVGRSLYGLALQNPNGSFWAALGPNTTPAELRRALTASGATQEEIDDLAGSLTTRVIDPATGMARTALRPGWSRMPNVVSLRVQGVDRVVLFSNKSDAGVRLARTLRGEDRDLTWLPSNRLFDAVGHATRWLASVNTQFNPIFGFTNVTRDIQEALLNLSSTALRGHESEVLGRIPSATKAIWRHVRGKPLAGALAQYYREFLESGAATGYRDSYTDIEDRARALEKALHGKGLRNLKGVKQTLDLLSDFNETLENSTRLAVFATARKMGLSAIRAASIAKDITVNFNRRGASSGLSRLYAFFNAAVQGIARTARTLRGPNGRKIILGGVALGVLQAVMGALGLGEDDWDEIPEFEKAKNLILPIPGLNGKYTKIPMPLGFNVLPNIGRGVAEMAIYRDKTAERVGNLLLAMIDAVNPLGSGGFMEAVTPSVGDPAVALYANRDSFGRPIYKENISSLDPQPGFRRARETTGRFWVELSRAINAITGGDEDAPGGVSPTPEAFAYLFGAVTGGLGREMEKGATMVGTLLDGSPPPAYRIPLVSRFYGETQGEAATRARYYRTVEAINVQENRMMGQLKRGGEADDEAIRVGSLGRASRMYQRAIGDLGKLRRRSEDKNERRRLDGEILVLQGQLVELLDRARGRGEAMDGDR
jgi:soluble lytic murein transglycosylase-like protein/GNAT superfamily N-acetyltransferase